MVDKNATKCNMKFEELDVPVYFDSQRTCWLPEHVVEKPDGGMLKVDLRVPCLTFVNNQQVATVEIEGKTYVNLVRPPHPQENKQSSECDKTVALGGAAALVAFKDQQQAQQKLQEQQPGHSASSGVLHGLKIAHARHLLKRWHRLQRR